MAKKYVIKINDDLPVPESVHRGRTYTFPFDRLEIGQHFLVKGLKVNKLGPYKGYAEKALGRKFITKKTERGLAVWRIR